MASYQGMLTLVVTVVLLALPSLTCAVTLHVRPTSTNTSCPTNPCHTLSEYAEGLGQYFNDSNLTLQFLPGNHTLSVNLTITGIYQLELLGNSSAEVPIRVLCNSSIGFSVRNYIPVVRLDSAYVGHGGGVCIRSNSNMAFSGNTTFITNVAGRAGGGVYVGSSSKISIHGNTTFDSS